ncbi:Uu.00g133360.m01.CDS01 [Anthostomella pinea]|uniref:Uu.00g133360.m01.CDS01 n=1 Tax=Anthostomella pinea TaxID=933095 RepID=A0AAI8VSY3_9PEZI|nr:Uu.00g133360.m01.CDS01 [Anthostomella pinea]
MTAHILSPAPGGFNGLQSWVQCDDPVDLLSREQASIPRQPIGFPVVAEGPKVWSGYGRAAPSLDSLVIQLDQAGVIEVEAALESFLGLALDGDEVNRDRFPLPRLAGLLEQCAQQIHHGNGVCIIRGLAGHRSPEHNTIIFLGIASYIGGQRGVQSAKGAMICEWPDSPLRRGIELTIEAHVYESKLWTVPRGKRHGIHTNVGLPFHNDMGCDILAMHVRQRAATGGDSYVASCGAVYNDLMTTNAWAVHTLTEANWPIQVSRRGSSPYVLSPLLTFHEGNMMVSADPARIGPPASSTDTRIPSLLPEQHEALALVQQSASKHQVRLPACAGDMVFLNNWALLHARESYRDDDESTRHLVRLWLRNEKLAWDIPASMKVPWDAAFGERSKATKNRQYPVNPMPEYMEPKFGNGTAAFVADESDEETDN